MVEGVPQDMEHPKTPEVRVHMGNFFPYASVRDNKTIVGWAKEAQADGVEWIAAGPVMGKLPVGPTHDILVKPVSALQEIVTDIKSGHVTFNPYATVWNIAARKEDPLHPGQPIAAYNTILSTQNRSEKALQKIQQMRSGNFPVVVYPLFNGNKIREDAFATKLLQTHPFDYNDTRDADGLIQAVKNGEYAGVCVDTYHFQEATNTGLRPFGETEKELFASLDKLQEAGALKEVHVQPGRMINLDTSIEDHDKELAAMFGENPSYDTRLGRMLKHLIHDLGFMGPYTWEIDPRALIATHGKKVMLPPQVGPILQAQAAAVDYIRRA